jgi:hypothetical protein
MCRKDLKSNGLMELITRASTALPRSCGHPGLPCYSMRIKGFTDGIENEPTGWKTSCVSITPCPR